MEQGAQVSPQRYLADTVAGARAVSDFSKALATIGSPAKAAALRRAAPDLTTALTRASAIADRLAGERLEDQRIEVQRVATSSAMADVVTAMGGVVSATAAGDPTAAVRAVRDYAARVGDLRSATATP